MPRVTFVKSARKDNPVCKKGESYYWWKFRYGGKRFSLTRPRQSQLTQSAYYGTLYSMQEGIEDYELDSYDDFETLKDDISGQIQDLSSETQDSLDNMPDQLQYSPTGELLQERIDALDGAESELDYIDEFEFDRVDFEDAFEPSDFEDEEEMEAERSGHEESEDDREQEEFNAWAMDAKSAMIEALDGAVV